MAVPVRSELLSQIDSLARRQLSCWARGLDARRTELRAAARALPAADELLAVPRQRLDALSERLPRALHANAQIHHKEFLRCASRLSPPLLRGRLRRDGERLNNAGGRLAAAVRANIAAHRKTIVRDRERVAALFERGGRAVTRLIERRQASVERAEKLLAAYSYHGVLARGFALVRDAAGQPLRAAAQVSTGAALEIEFHDGRVGAIANGEGAPTSAPKPEPKPKARKGGGEGQGSLF
jgi:exodeoxyribonuclease VII large subunit